MKTLTHILLKAITLTTLVGFIFMSCSEEDAASEPAVATGSASEITFSSVTLSGTISSNGGSQILAKGFCFSASPDPTIMNDTTNQGEGSEAFVSNLSDLTPNTMYYA